jgi:hypothetical protein
MVIIVLIHINIIGPKVIHTFLQGCQEIESCHRFT